MPKKEKSISYKPENLDTGETFKNKFYPIMPKHPFQMVIGGSTETGKTNTLMSLFIYHPHSPINHTIWIGHPNTIHQPKIEKMSNRLKKKFDLVAGLDVEEIDLLIGQNKGKQILLVFDDLVNAKNKDVMNDVFMSGRHRGSSVCEITQNIFSEGAMGRRQNCGLYLLTNFGDKTGVKRLFLNLFGKEDAAKVFEQYKKCMVGMGSGAFFMIDNKCMIDENEDNHIMRFRCHSLDNVMPDVL